MAVHRGDPRISPLQMEHFPTKHHHPYYRVADDVEKPATRVRIGIQWKRWYDPELGCWRQDVPGPAERAEIVARLGRAFAGDPSPAERGQIAGRLSAGSDGRRASRGRGKPQERVDRVTTPVMGGSWVGWRHEGASSDELRARRRGY